MRPVRWNESTNSAGAQRAAWRRLARCAGTDDRCSIDATGLSVHVRADRRLGVGLGRASQSSAASAADLTTLAAGSTGLVRGPLVRGALLVGCTPPLAGYLTLLLRGHGSKPSTFF